MAKRMKRVQKKKSVLLEIYDNALLRSKIDAALDNKVPYTDIIKIADNYGVSVSAPTISRYAKARTESSIKGTDLRKSIDGETKNALERIKKKEEKHKEIENVVTTPVYVSDIQFLDTLISKKFSGLVSADPDDIPWKDAIAAINVKNKLDGGANKGLGVQGLRELQLYSQAKYTALTQAVLKFVPEEKQQEAIDYMDKVEKDQLKQMEVTPQNKLVVQILKENGVKI
ncbi:hypothetical protein [Lactobacillus phage Lbab1]|nr:hypothetical protein [Lactobacillus phage Lbab1]